MTSALLTILVAWGMEPQTAVDRFAGDSDLRHASVGVAVMSIDSGKIIASNHLDLAITTASTMKTVTSTVALETLGADFLFHTRVYLVGDTAGGTLRGNVLIVGGGDPTLGSRHFPRQANIITQVVDSLKRWGIRTIAGTLTVDESLYPFPPYSIYWDVGDLAWDYGAAVHALNWRDNNLEVNFTVDKWGRLSDASLKPSTPDVAIINRTRLNTRESSFDMALEYATPAVVLMGDVKPGRHSHTVSNPLPQSTFIAELTRALSKAGIELKGDAEVLDNTTRPARRLLVDHESPSLPDIITSLLDRSDNMFTHALLLAVGAKEGATSEIDAAGVRVAKRTLKRLGCDSEALFMRDGSGLARAGRASARMMVQMLSAVADKHYGDVRLCDLMPQANHRIGSLLPETHLRRDIVLKSGSMTDVQCFVGYYPADKPRYAFAVLLNNYNCSRKELKQKIERRLINLFDEK